MKVVKIVTASAMMLSLISAPINVFADQPQHPKAETMIENSEEQVERATVSKFSLYGHDLLPAYDETFKMGNDNIASMTNNGRNYPGSPLEKAIDGKMNTHWETNKQNDATFTNEVIFNFNETTSLNRIVYAARQDGAKGKGFAQEFDIYGSTTDKGNDFALVSSGEYKGSTGDIVEIQFKPTAFKRLKFVYKKANQNWASASEFQFYKEDPTADKMARLFTDKTSSEVAKEFNTIEALNKLEEEAKSHPLYSQYKEGLQDAKELILKQDISSSQALTKLFLHYDNKKYTELFKMDNENIQSIRANTGQYANQVINNAIDGKLDTYWETNRPNSSTFSQQVEVDFKEAVEINRIVYGARHTDRKGFAEEFEIYASQTTKGDTYQLLSTGGHPTVGGLVEAKFEPTKIKRLKFKFKKSNQNWATLSELAFYKEDVLEDKIDNLFTNGLMLELKEEYASMDIITQYEKEIEDHPLVEQFQEKLDIAKDILNDDVDSIGVTVTASQRGNAETQAQKHQIARTSFSLDTFGKYVVPGETIKVYVDADENGVMPNIVLGQIADNKNGWYNRYSLKPGLNTITAPSFSSMSPAVVYVENPALPSQQGYAPNVRLVGGTSFPVYYHGKTDPTEFEKELEAYVAKISVNDQDFANGKPKDVVYNVAELVSENNVIATSAAGALQGIKDMKPSGKTVSDTMDEWEIMWHEFQKISGFAEGEEGFNAKFNSRVFSKGPYAWSAGGYTGYNGGNSPKRDGGFFRQIVQPISQPGNDSWAYYHEWGHNHNNSYMEHVEVTNNLYAVIMMKKINNSNDDRVDWNTLYKRFSGEKVGLGFWTNLGILQQIQYYYGEDTYGKASRISRLNQDGVMDGMNSSLQRLVIGFSLATETDLTGFFEDWGYVTATDVMKKKVAHLPKPDVKLEYMHSLGRNYEGAGFSHEAKVTVNAITADKAKKEIKLSYDIDRANKDAAMGYEILRDGKVVGYTTNATFTDKNVDTDRAYAYEIVAYDKKLKSLKPTEVNSQQPNLSVEDHLTLKLHQKFDPLDFVKASTYQGTDITKDVVVKSDNVDVTKKGTYEIVYEVKNLKITETKTTKVTVVSDFAYLSDMKAERANIAWGGLKKDLAPAGSAITLVRQGLDVIYEKGIGAHANSEVVYDIEGKGYNFFESYIGIDQAMKGNPSSATFEVWVDGEKKYDSKVFRADTKQEFVQVPVSGAKEVKLITTDAKNNGNKSDHTVWADAKFTNDNARPQLTIPKATATKVGTPIELNGKYTAIDPEDGDLTTAVQVTGKEQVNFDRAGKYEITYAVTDSDGNEVTAKRTISVVNMEDYHYLSDFDWTSTQNSYTAPKKDISVSGKTLRLTAEDGSEVAYKKGIGAHSTSTIIYDLTDKDADYFTSFVGVDRQMYGSVGSVAFQVFVDGEKKFDSGLMNSRDPQQFVEVNSSGAKELKLVVTDGGNGIGSDHATWGDAKLHFANVDRIFTQDLEAAIEEAKAINTVGYTNDSVEVLQASIAKAEDVVANKQSTQAEIDQAIELLKQAIESLVAIDLGQIITIPDPILSTFIKQSLGITGEITLGDMYKLTSLSAAATQSERVASLEGLQYAKNLVTLDITGNEVVDFSPLKGLKQLENLLADPQVIEMASPTGQDAIFNVENLVKGLDGKHVNPTQIALRHNRTFEEVVINVDQLEANATQFTIDLTKEDKGFYTLAMVYEVEGNRVQIISMINHQ